MSRKLKWFLLLVFPVLWNACSLIDEDLDRCEIYLQFVYDYNMDYVCSFTTHVPTVDVLVFDAEGKYLFTKFATCATELIDGNKMSLADDLEFGTYQILAVGNLTNHFAVSHLDGTTCTAGATTLDQVYTALQRESESVEHEFSPLWVSNLVEIDYTRDLVVDTTWTVPLMKYTNQFNIVLYRDDHPSVPDSRSTVYPDVPIYTFEIITPEGALYYYDHSPVSQDGVNYLPYALNFGATPDSYSVGNLNTVRLMDYRNTRAEATGSGYRLVVRNTRTFKEAWNVDLINLLENFKPESNPDGSELSMQEFLDRKSVWDIAILHRGGGLDDEHDVFMTLAVRVGPWIKWLHEMNLQ
jgi:Protein of unknown function (DUF1812).